MCTWSRRRMRLMKWILKVWRSHRVGQGKVHWIWQTSLNWIKSVFNFQQKTLLLQALTFGPCLWSTQHQSVVLFLVGKVWVSHEYCKTTLRDGSVPYQSYHLRHTSTIGTSRGLHCIRPWCGTSPWPQLNRSPLAISKAIPLNAQADFRTAGFVVPIFFLKACLSPKICRDRKVASMEYT